MIARDIRNTPDDLSIKAATEALVSAVGGRDKAEGYSRLDQRRYSDFIRSNTNSFIPADAIVALEKRSVGTLAWPQLTRELARQTGHVLVRLPTCDVDQADCLSACAVVHAKESNDVTVKILALAPRGRLTAAAVRDNDLVREGREAVEAAVKLLAMLEAIEAEGGR